MQFDYSLIDEQLVITDPKDFHYNCDEHPVDGDKLIIDMPTDEVKALRDYLDTELERYQATRRNPEEPEPIEDGFYVTQDGTLIYRDSGNQPCGGQIPQRPTAVRNERHTGRAGTIPKHDRRNAHWRKMKEGETV